MEGMGGMEGMSMPGTPVHAPTSAFSTGLPMSRDGSGTSWLPDAAPVYGAMPAAGPWILMFGEGIFPRVDQQGFPHGGPRGGEKWDAPDMIMGMAQRRWGTRGILHFSLMLSTDPLIDGGNGYPLLFQTGESWKGKPLVDRQHPHDLFSELSASYAFSFSQKTDLFIYLGYPGEPALGPVTFMHRPSGMFDPDAPIGHHWEDATHITFGVATLGIRLGRFRIEGSSFTGREPDENRYDFDPPRMDSWSGRFSFNPDPSLSFQVSTGHLLSPEALRPLENLQRTTASGSYVHWFGDRKYIAATGLWGENAIPGQAPSNAALWETTMKWNRLTPYMRWEWVQKSAGELNLDPALFGNGDLPFPIQALTGGIAYDLFPAGPLVVAGGAQLTWYHAPALDAVYGKNPLAIEAYLHLYPALMKTR